MRRKGAKDVALVTATELAGLMKTARLLRSPRNAHRLLSALRRAKLGHGKPPQSPLCAGMPGSMRAPTNY